MYEFLHITAYSRYDLLEFQSIRYRDRINISSGNKASFLYKKWNSKIFICW